uniref:Uncharacterized protein n=1 Tax=Tanacetum cinerariifolium TaxID=118510 RepID=A0A6L2KHM1_TANCI|nr:hypothetical protein [Tanacetum cinerariifolium]
MSHIILRDSELVVEEANPTNVVVQALRENQENDVALVAHVLRRSCMPYYSPNMYYGYLIDSKARDLEDHEDPETYRKAMLGSRSNQWIKAMNAETQSMKDIEVRDLVDLPHGGKTVGYKSENRLLKWSLMGRCLDGATCGFSKFKASVVSEVAVADWWQPVAALYSTIDGCIILPGGIGKEVRVVGHLKGAVAGTTRKAMNLLTGRKEEVKKLSEIRKGTKHMVMICMLLDGRKTHLHRFSSLFWVLGCNIEAWSPLLSINTFIGLTHIYFSFCPSLFKCWFEAFVSWQVLLNLLYLGITVLIGLKVAYSQWLVVYAVDIKLI